MQTDRRRAVAALATAGVAWGTTVPLSKLVLGWLAPGWLTFTRFGLAAAILLAAASRTRLRAAFTLPVLVSGAIGYGGSVVVQNAGIARTSVTHAALLIGAVPVLVAVIAALWHHTVARPVAWLGFAVSLAGVGLTTSGRGGGATVGGDALVLLSLLLSASATVAQSRLLRGRDPVAVTAVQFLGAALAALPLSLATEGMPAAPGGPGVVLATAGLVAGGTLLPFTLFAYGQSRISAEVAGAFLNLEPLVGAVAGAVIFGNPVGLQQATGGTAILAGIALSSLPALGARPGRRRAASPRLAVQQPGRGLAGLFRVQAGQPGELEPQMQREPVVAAAQADTGELLRLGQPVVQGAAVQPQPLRARLRVTGQVKIGLQSDKSRRVGLVEQYGKPWIDARHRVGVHRQLGQRAVHPEVVPARDRAGTRDRGRHPGSLPGLAVGNTRFRQGSRLPRPGHRLHAGGAAPQPRQQAGAGGGGQFEGSGRPVVVGDEHPVIGSRQADHVAGFPAPGDVPERLAEHRPRQRHRRGARPHHHRDHRPAQAEQAAVPDVAHRVRAQLVQRREQVREYTAGQPLAQRVAEHQQASLVRGEFSGSYLAATELCFVVDEPQVSQPCAPVPDRHAQAPQDLAVPVARHADRAVRGIEAEPPEPLEDVRGRVLDQN